MVAAGVLVFLIVIITTRFVSLASMLSASSIPVFFRFLVHAHAPAQMLQAQPVRTVHDPHAGFLATKEIFSWRVSGWKGLTTLPRRRYFGCGDRREGAAWIQER